MSLVDLATSAPLLLVAPGLVARILTMGMVCAVLIWLKHRQ